MSTTKTNKKINESSKVKEFRLKLYPKNFYKVRAFYEDILGYPVIDEWDGVDKGVKFDTGGATLELLTPEGDYLPVQGASVSWEVKDVMKLWEKIKDKVDIEFEPRHNSWGDTSFRITDPEGFKITFFTKD